MLLNVSQSYQLIYALLVVLETFARFLCKTLCQDVTIPIFYKECKQPDVIFATRDRESQEVGLLYLLFSDECNLDTIWLRPCTATRQNA